MDKIHTDLLGEDNPSVASVMKKLNFGGFNNVINLTSASTLKGAIMADHPCVKQLRHGYHHDGKRGRLEIAKWFTAFINSHWPESDIGITAQIGFLRFSGKVERADIEAKLPEITTLKVTTWDGVTKCLCMHKDFREVVPFHEIPYYRLEDGKFVSSSPHGEFTKL